MLLAFVGQVTAISVIPCKMTQQHSNNMSMNMSDMDMSHTNMSSTKMTGMDHSSHQMSDGSDDASTLDCCKAGANCSMGTCVSMLSVTVNSLSNNRITSQKVEQAALILISQTSNSLYRPPILS